MGISPYRQVLVLAFAISAQSVALQATANAEKQNSANDQKVAIELFERSKLLYQQGKFQEAAQLLSEAYGLFPEPILKYNLARSLEGLGDLEGAIKAYTEYLESVDQIKDRGAIEHRVTTMREQLESLAVKPSAPPSTALPATINPETEAVKKRPARTQSVVPYAIAGLGLATIATGGYFGWRAGSLHDDAIAEPSQRGAMAFQDDAENAADIANVLFVIGGTGLAIGAVWALYSADTPRSSEGISIRIGPTSLTALGSF